MEKLILPMVCMRQLGVLETTATATSIALLGPYNCLGTILCERGMLGNRKKPITRLVQVIHDVIVKELTLRNVTFTLVWLGRSLREGGTCLHSHPQISLDQSYQYPLLS